MPGPRPTNVEAVLDYVDAQGASGRATFPVPVVDMIPKTRWDIFFPAVLKAQCRPKRADVVMVLDSSSSMTGEARPGITKLDEAVKSARTFLDAMQLPDDRAAIVTFDSGARVNQSLTGSRPALEFALAGISAGRGTRIDLGLETGLGEVLGPNHAPGNTPVMIVLTDGRPAGGSEAATVANADLSQRLGVELFMIGLGADADQLLLLLLAGDPRNFYFAPTTDALAAIYASIAGDVLCR
ncbi:MAG: VWA domain-containing protein [Anaerolineae bacterium]